MMSLYRRAAPRHGRLAAILGFSGALLGAEELAARGAQPAAGDAGPRRRRRRGPGRGAVRWPSQGCRRPRSRCNGSSARACRTASTPRASPPAAVPRDMLAAARPLAGRDPSRAIGRSSLALARLAAGLRARRHHRRSRGLGPAGGEWRRRRIFQIELDRLGLLLPDQLGGDRQRHVDPGRDAAAADEPAVAHHSGRDRHGAEPLQFSATLDLQRHDRFEDLHERDARPHHGRPPPAGVGAAGRA